MQPNQVKKVTVTPKGTRFIEGILPDRKRLQEETTLYLNQRGIKRAMRDSVVLDENNKLLDETNFFSEEGAILAKDAEETEPLPQPPSEPDPEPEVPDPDPEEGGETEPETTP